jgi:hypothetical protein
MGVWVAVNTGDRINAVGELTWVAAGVKSVSAVGGGVSSEPVMGIGGGVPVGVSGVSVSVEVDAGIGVGGGGTSRQAPGPLRPLL